MPESRKLVIGAAPEGARDAHSAAHAVREMFTSIAPRYDLLNHVLSFNVDRLWWRRTARTFQDILAQPNARVLDLCCGTGDMTFALRRQAGNSAQILGADFSHAMLQRALQKSRRSSQNARQSAPAWIEADALTLPFPDAHFDLVTSAFGFRNLANYEEGLAELHRILRPGGQLGILECNQPEGLTGAFYNLYFKTILPNLGGLISGKPAAYSYLPASVERFPRPPRMIQLIKNAGFTNATWTSFTFGIAGLYHATKP